MNGSNPFRYLVIAAATTASTSGWVLGGASVILPVAQDESVNSAFPEKNYSDNMNRGGLFAGVDGTGTGVSRFYLQFDLPNYIAPTDVALATLWGTYEDDLDRNVNGIHRINFVAADDWKESTINWVNQPGPSYGTPQALFDSAASKPGDVVKFDVTDLVRQEMKGDGKLSLVFAAANESVERANRNWEYFAEHEFNPEHAFHLTLSTSARVGGGGGPVAVPLPPAAWPGLATLGAMMIGPAIRRAKHLRAK